MKNGKARRVPGDDADELVHSGQAKHYISNTVFRAMKLGIEVPDPKTRDDDGALHTEILEARVGLEKQREKSKKKRKKE